MSCFYLIFLVIFVFKTAYGNDCSICDCKETINLVHCFGYQVTNFPNITDNIWVQEISMIKTRITDLPLRHGYPNLRVIYIEDCQFISCYDVLLFYESNQNLEIITDMNCFKSTSEKYTTMTSSDNYFSTNGIYISTTTKPTEDSISLLIIIIILSAILGLITLTIALGFLYFKRHFAIETAPAMIELSDL